MLESCVTFLNCRLDRFVTGVFYLTFLALILPGCQTIPSDKKTLVLGEDGWNSDCISLRAIKIDDDGAALLFFEKQSYNNYNMCYTALVSSVITQPTKTIISANDIDIEGNFFGSFSLKVKPNTSSVIMATTDPAGISTTLQFDVGENIRQAQVLSQNSAWMDGIIQSQSALIEKETNDNVPPRIKFNDKNFSKRENEKI